MASMIDVPAIQVPPFKYDIAMKSGIKKVLMTTWGGIGDQVVAEPTLRYSFKLFKEYEISLLTSFPELFTHLPFKRVYHKSESKNINEDEFMVIHTNPPHNNLARDFVTHHFTQVVDFCSLCAFARQLPIRDREICLVGDEMDLLKRDYVVIHPGRHWQSKTFPKKWWDEVIQTIVQAHFKVLIVGADTREECGTVDVDATHCLDLRNKLSLKESTTVLKRARVVITNDSSPLHIAAAGPAHILLIASCKEPDHLFHWREGKFGWRMKNLGLDGLWNYLDSCPARTTDFRIDTMPEKLLNDLLPSPASVKEEVINCIYAPGYLE